VSNCPESEAIDYLRGTLFGVYLYLKSAERGAAHQSPPHVHTRLTTLDPVQQYRGRGGKPHTGRNARGNSKIKLSTYLDRRRQALKTTTIRAHAHDCELMHDHVHVSHFPYRK
jgi:hypothetical protein